MSTAAGGNRSSVLACPYCAGILTPLGKRSCNSGAGFSFELCLVLPTSHFWHCLLRGVVQVQGKSGDGWQRAGCLTCQRMRDARYAHRAERFKNATLPLSHIFQNGQFVFYVYLPISKAYALVLYFSSFLSFGFVLTSH